MLHFGSNTRQVFDQFRAVCASDFGLRETGEIFSRCAERFRRSKINVAAQFEKLLPPLLNAVLPENSDDANKAISDAPTVGLIW